MQQQSKATASGLPRGHQRVKGAGGATETGQHFVACLAVFAWNWPETRQERAQKVQTIKGTEEIQFKMPSDILISFIFQYNFQGPATHFLVAA